MGLLKRLLDLMLDRRVRATNEAPSLVSATEGNTRLPTPTRTFTIKEALNGTYIEFLRYKWNPNKADDYEACVYIVREGETLVEAISTVLVLMDRPTEG